MSKVTVYLAVGGAVSVDIDAEDPASELASQMATGFVTFETDKATLLVNRDHIVRVDIPREPA